MTVSRASFFLVTAGLFLSVAFHLFYYPRIYAFQDESDYLAVSTVLRQGTVWIDQTDVPVRSQIEAQNGHSVSDYQPGMSLLLLPWTLWNWQAIFLLNLLVHLAGAWCFWKFLRRFKVQDPFWILLYLFYPPFIFYSRTIMSDLPAAVLFLAGCAAYFNKKNFWAGTCWGLSLLLRETNAVFFLPFLGVSAWQAWKFKSAADFRRLCLGLAPGMLAQAAYNFYAFGGFSISGHLFSLQDISFFSFGYFGANFKHYAMNLLLVYPLMPAACFFSREFRRPELLFSIGGGLLFFCFYFFHDRFSSKWETWIFGARYLFPVIPFFLAAVAETGERQLRHFSEFWGRGIKVLTLVLLAGGAFFVHRAHDQALQKQAAMKELIYRSTEEGSSLLYDLGTAELIQKVWGRRDYDFVDNGNWETVFAGKKLDRPVYLAVRSFYSDGVEQVSIGQSVLEEARRRYSLELIGRRHNLALYRVHHAGKI